MARTNEPTPRTSSCSQLSLLFVALLALSSVMASSNIAIALDPEPWRAVNDGVMGGVSAGEIVALDDGLRFQGELSLENNGGFASARRLHDAAPGDIRGIRLRVKGDGRQYQFRIRTDDRFDGVSWRHQFVTNQTWQTIELMLRDFEPVFRGRKVRGAGPLDPLRIRQLGFLLADGKPGSFRLDIAAIEFVDS